MTPQYPDPSYAFWTDPKTGFIVTYSIALLQDIQAAVEAGFRRINHGGIEVGGILLGRHTEAGVLLEGFQTIACQYAFGPSFRLSASDIERLKTQLEALSTDYDLADSAGERAHAVGFFVSHTRGPLVLTDSEAQIFREFFPGQGTIAVLVKPDLVEPPLISFLTRGPAGEIEREGRPIAIRVPVPEEGTVATAAEPIPSIAAPVEIPSPMAVHAAPEMASPTQEESVLSDETPVLDESDEAESEAEEEDEEFQEGEFEEEDFDVIEAEVVEIEYIEQVTAASESEVVAEQSEQSAETPSELELESESEEELEPKEELEPEAVSVAEPEPEGVTATPEAATTDPVEPQKAARAKAPPLSEPAFTVFEDGAAAHQDTLDQHRVITRKIQFSTMRLAAVLALAALLGCSAGYWLYAQLPPAIIPLRAQAQPPILTLTWPAETTRDAVWAGIRIDNGQAIPLSNSDKEKGQAQISFQSDSVKVELIAQHWMRDSHGIVRFINGVPPQASSSAPH